MLFFALFVVFPAAAQIPVVATTPDLASIARLMAGDLVAAESLVPPGTDAEAFEPRPGDLARLRGARLVVRVGLGYDHWLDRLLAQHGEATLQRGGPGHVDASLGIPLLEVQGRSIEAAGHAHGAANPHYWLDPENALVIGAAIAEGLLRVAPGEQDRIIAAHDRFVAAVGERMIRWSATLASFRGAAIVAFHNSWPYLARRFRLDIVEVIEPKEGVAPSPARIARLAGVMRDRQVRAILQEPFAPDDAARLLVQRTGARIVRLAPSVGALPEASDYFALFDHDLGALARALAAPNG